MKERPILFSAPMVRAILAGTKTQTRRVLAKPPPPECSIHYPLGNESWLAKCDRTPLRHLWEAWGGPLFDTKPAGWLCGRHEVVCPYGAPGDRLWVRETWKSSEYRCEDEPQDDDHECDAHCDQKLVFYRATPRIGSRPVPDGARMRYLDDSSPLTDWYESGWRPSIHMPRWASRLTLDVTSVRVERLQDISDVDARAEGVTVEPNANHGHVGAFADLWESINGKRAPWSSNPWVWVVGFSRVQP